MLTARAAVATILGKRVDIERLCRWRRGCRQHIVVADDGGAAAKKAKTSTVQSAAGEGEGVGGERGGARREGRYITDVLKRSSRQI